MNAIETKQLTKCFGAVTAVDALDLTVREGELFGLLGVNGAGKTTTIKMLSGLLKPTDGTARVLGYDLDTELSKIKPYVAVSPQETAIAPNLTARENLELIAGIYGSDPGRVQKMIDELGLKKAEKIKAKALSGGWQRRLSIAMALVSDPKLLFLDEPTLGLDVLARRELWKVIEGLKGKVTVILTTHYLEEAEALSDRVGVMNDGRLKIVGTPQELLDAAGTTNFEEAFIKLAGGEAL